MCTGIFALAPIKKSKVDTSLFQSFSNLERVEDWVNLRTVCKSENFGGENDLILCFMYKF